MPATASAQSQDPAPAAPSPAAAAAPPTPAADLRETVHRLPIAVVDLFGRSETRDLVLTLFRPAGAGPHPLLILNHGRSGSNRALPARQRFEVQARYFVRKGFAVLVPTRIGYGEGAGDFDPEESGPCNSKRYGPMAAAASSQVLAALEWARGQSGIDTSRWVVAGQSVGGLTTLATVARNPAGLVGGINFAGGAGGNPDTRAGNPCDPEALRSLWASQGKEAKLPTAWLYWSNDKYWGEANPKRWFDTWAAGGSPARFFALAPVGTDGHGGIGQDMDRWVPLVEEFLAKLGFAQPGLIARPAASGFAALHDVDKLPLLSSAVRTNAYPRFLQTTKPRAFAIGPDGSWGFASGDWAMGRALGNCQRSRGVECKLYAVDDDVVWQP